MTIDDGLSLYAAIYSTIAAPFFAWFWSWLAGRRRERNRIRSLVGRLRGLPQDLKAVLVQFQMQGAHTVAGNPSAPAIRQLRAMRIISVGEGRGSYDAVDAYLSIAGDVWDVFDKWAKVDPDVSRLTAELLAPAPEELGSR